jgi:hypothetical protein
VYRAWDERLGRRVAVKVLSARALGSPEQARRLETEARAAAAIAHPNVVTVYDAGRADGLPFLVSELVEGESLRSVLDAGALPRERALRLALDLARGLGAAHARGVVHRDLKPGNLIVTRDGSLKILDFGLARITVPEPGADLDATRPGTVLGTAGYLSPEQARGEPADPRSDIFAAGAILFEMLTGRRAFDGATFADRLSAVLRDAPPGLTKEALGDAYPVVARCLEKDPARRFQSAQDLAFTLEGLVDGAPPRAAPPPRAISRRAFALGAAGAGIAGVLAGRLLAGGRAPAEAVYQQLTFRQGRVTTARFTHDGGSVIYGAAWDDQPVTVFATRLGRGGTRALALPPADVLAVSARGEVAVSLGRRYVVGFHQAGRLAIAPIEGGEPRPVADEIQDADFAPDDDALAVIRRGGAGFRLELPPGRVLLEHPGWLSDVRVSPDGARVACLTHPNPHDDRGAVVVIDRRTGAAREFARDWSSVVGLAWAPGGRELWFSAAKTGGNNAVRSVSLDGRVGFVAGSIGRLRVHDLARDGRAAVTHDAWRVRLLARPPGAGAEIDLSLSDVSLVADISGDGGTILFGEAGDVELESGTYLRPTRGGPALRLGPGLPRALSPDGRFVLAELFGPPSRLVVYPTGAGDAQPVPLGPIEDMGWARWLRDDALLVGGAASGRRPRIWLVPRSGAAPVPLTDEGVSGQGYPSHDGRRIAFITNDGRCMLVPTDAPGAPRVLPGAYPGSRVCGFLPGDGALWVRSTQSPIRIQRVDLATGVATPHAELVPPALGQKGVESVVWSPAGDAYAYSYGQELSRLYALVGSEEAAAQAAEGIGR